MRRQPAVRVVWVVRTRPILPDECVHESFGLELLAKLSFVQRRHFVYYPAGIIATVSGAKDKLAGRCGTWRPARERRGTTSNKENPGGPAAVTAGLLPLQARALPAARSSLCNCELRRYLEQRASGSARWIFVSVNTMSPMRGSLRLVITTVCKSLEYHRSVTITMGF